MPANNVLSLPTTSLSVDILAGVVNGLDPREADALGVSCQYFADVLAQRLADLLQGRDPRFDRERFFELCGEGVDDDVTTPKEVG